MKESMLSIRNATLEDLDAVDHLALTVIESMREGGLFQWDVSYPRASHYAQDIHENVVFVCLLEGVIVGVMSVHPENDPPYQEITWLKDHSLVLHRLIVDPKHRRLGIAQRLLDHAYRMVGERGYASLKIDTHPHNTAMRSLLKKNHFVELDFLHGIFRIAYEKIHHTQAIQKVLIFGNAGTGKTTLARDLAYKQNLTACHLDSIYWKKDWQSLPDEEFTQRVAAFIEQTPSFTMDGNYTNSQSLPLRLSAADTLIFLDYSTSDALQGIIQREKQYRHRFRTDMAEGCIENIDDEFLDYVAGYHTQRRLLILKLFAAHYKEKVCLRFTSRAQLEHWMAQL
jgi:adenylate kinase family enzyme/ribosomal protein S18 acetylase RimI-like enzyme